MGVYDERPWLDLYGDMPTDVEPEHGNALEMFRAGLATDPSGTAVSYFDGVLSRTELDDQSDALACALLAQGFAAGDHVFHRTIDVRYFESDMTGVKRVTAGHTSSPPASWSTRPATTSASSPG